MLSSLKRPLGHNDNQNVFKTIKKELQENIEKELGNKLKLKLFIPVELKIIIPVLQLGSLLFKLGL